MPDKMNFVCHDANIVFTDIGDQMVVLNAKEGKYYSLVLSGRDLWERLAEPVQVSALCADLAAVYAADPQDIERETLEFLAYLHSAGLIRVC